MRNLIRVALVVVLVSSLFTACTNDSLAEDQQLYEQGTEGSDGSVEEKPVG